MLIQNVYLCLGRQKGAEFLGNIQTHKQTDKQTDTELYILVQISYCVIYSGFVF